MQITTRVNEKQEAGDLFEVFAFYAHRRKNERNAHIL